MKKPGENAPLHINSKRLWSRHMEMARIGTIDGTGNCRLALSDEDAAARTLFARWCRDAGMKIRSDRAGNIFAIRPGRNASLPAVASGSHLDTQPHGGSFDGISGVLAALEVVESLNDAGIETEAPIVVVNWTNEEGVRFAPGLLGSSWFTGRISDAALAATVASDGVRFVDELERIGWNGTQQPSDMPFDSFFELHIEQGPLLEQTGVPVGVVDSVQGLQWLDVTVLGTDAHAGTTPLDARRDALLAAAEIIVGLNHAGRSAGQDARVSVGRLRSATDGPSTIAGKVDLMIDIRHPDDKVLTTLTETCRAVCLENAATHKCKVRIAERITIPPRLFDTGCVAAIEAAVQTLKVPHYRLPSGALHDAANIATIAPAAMIFVRCRDGISHNIKEYASLEDLTMGCNVLLHAMLSRAIPGT